MDVLDVFLRLYEPPPDPPVPTDWSAVRSRLGMALPRDYEAIVDVFGLGRFDRTIVVYVPEHDQMADIYGLFDQRAEQLGFVHEAQVEYRALAAEGLHLDDVIAVDENGDRHTIDLGGQPLPYLPCGMADTGEYLYWDTTGPDPDDWPVVMTDLGGRWMIGTNGLAGVIVDTQLGRYPRTMVVPADTLPSFTRFP